MSLSRPLPPAPPPSSAEERLQRLQLLDDHIGQALRASEASGELQRAPSYGRPLAADEGYEQTPAALRMPYKILKDAGVLPPEVQLMREVQALEDAVRAAADDAEARLLRQRIAEKRQHLALRLEKLRINGSL